MKIRTVIIDDEHLARQYLKDYVAQVPVLEYVGDFNSPLKAIDLIKSGKVDLLLLDIQMPDLNGLDFIRTLNPLPSVIITSAYKEYAIDGFELSVCDYLLKPFSFPRFLTAVNKVVALHKNDLTLSSQEAIQPTIVYEDYLMVRADRKFYRINFEDLCYVKGQGAYVTFHTTQKRITALYSLKDLLDKLPSDRFLRVHKSYIVASKMIDSFDGNNVTVCDTVIPIGKMYKESLDKILGIE